MSLLDAIKNKEVLSEDELYELVYVHSYKGETLELVEERVIDHTLKWENVVLTIFKDGDEYIGIEWLKGKTKMQEDWVDEQPKLYKRVTKTVYDYVAK